MKDTFYSLIKEDVDDYNKSLLKNNSLLYFVKSLEKETPFDSNLTNLITFILDSKKIYDLNKSFEKYTERFHDSDYNRFNFPNIEVRKQNIFYYLLKLDFTKVDNFENLKIIFTTLQDKKISLSKSKIDDFYDLNFTKLDTDISNLDDLKISPQVKFSTNNLSHESLLNHNIPSKEYQFFLNLYSKEMESIEFTKLLQEEGFLHFLIKNNRIDDLDYVMKNFNTNINLPNKDGTYPITEVNTLQTLKYIGNKYIIDWNCKDSEGKNIEQYFAKKQNSVNFLNYIKSNKNSLGIPVSKEEIYNKLLLLVESQHTKKAIESFIKTNDLKDTDFEKIKNNNNENLSFISINQRKFKYFDLFKIPKNITERNNNNIGVLELLLKKRFENTAKIEADTLILQLFKNYKEDKDWSFNLLCNFLNNSQRKYPYFNNIVFKPRFYQNILEDSDKFDEVLYNTQLSEVYKYKYFFLQHFSENQSIHKKTLLDFPLDTFLFNNSTLYFDEEKINFIHLILSSETILSQKNNFKFDEFIQKIETNIVKDLNKLYEEQLPQSLKYLLNDTQHNPQNISYENFLSLPNNEFKQKIIEQINKQFFMQHIESFEEILPLIIPYNQNIFMNFFTEIYSDFSIEHDINSQLFTYCNLQLYSNKIPINNNTTKKKNKL
jgi:hypothetical protein